ncbi:MAG TPA: DUF2812 domain-containing protein [Paenibacillus sp.]|jgi:hypothetical protein
MLNKVFRPFWSYDVNKTEEWLSSMAEKGYHFEKLNRGARYFHFKKGDLKKITYRIGYDKLQGDSLSSALLNAGWMKIVQSGHWYVLANENLHEQIKTSPVREGIIKHNRVIMYIFGSILIYLTTMSILFGTIISLVAFSQGGPFRVVESPYWILTTFYMSALLALWVLSIYSVIKINKTNNKLINENKQQNKLHRVYHNEGRLSKDAEKKLNISGQMVIQRKFGWMYAPDKLEKWLETMEEQGHNLYRISKTGTVFYFLKGSPLKVSYCADYQNIADESYFDIHRDSGWKSAFISCSSFQKWTLWSCEYLEGEERPQIYSDKSHHLKHARRIAITYSCLFLPLVIMNIFNISTSMELMLDNNIDNIQLMSIISVMLVILTLGSFSVRTWLYYMRLRKRYDYHL